MRRCEPLLEPFAPETLATIRASFHAGWKELTLGQRTHRRRMRENACAEQPA